MQSVTMVASFAGTFLLFFTVTEGVLQNVVINQANSSSMIQYEFDFISGDICASADVSFDSPCEDPRKTLIRLARLTEVQHIVRKRAKGSKGKGKKRRERRVVANCSSDPYTHDIPGFGNNSIGLDGSPGFVTFPDVNGDPIPAVSLNLTWFLDRQGQQPGAQMNINFYFFGENATIEFLGEEAPVFAGTVKTSYTIQNWKFCKTKWKRRRGSKKPRTCVAERKKRTGEGRDETNLELELLFINQAENEGNLVPQCRREGRNEPPGCHITSPDSDTPKFNLDYFTGMLVDGQPQCMSFEYPKIRDCLDPEPVSYKERLRKRIDVEEIEGCDNASIIIGLNRFKNNVFYDPCFCAFCGGVATHYLALSLLSLALINLLYYAF